MSAAPLSGAPAMAVALAPWLAGLVLILDAQRVVALRVAAVSLPGPDAALEWRRMLDEKPAAFAASALATGIALAGAQRADRIALAALRPLQMQVSANSERLRAAAGAADPVEPVPTADL